MKILGVLVLNDGMFHVFMRCPYTPQKVSVGKMFFIGHVPLEYF